MSKSRYFFTLEKAKAFAAQIEKNGAEFVKVLGFRDAFGQNQFVVRWCEY